MAKPHVSPHKFAEAPRGAEDDSAFSSSDGELACSDPHRQQIGSSIAHSAQLLNVTRSLLCCAFMNLLSIRAFYISGVLHRGADIMSRGDPDLSDLKQVQWASGGPHERMHNVRCGSP